MATEPRYTVHTTISLEPGMHAKLKRSADRQGISVAAAIRQALAKSLGWVGPVPEDQAPLFAAPEHVSEDSR